MDNMKVISITVPASVYDALLVLAKQKKVNFDDFCKAAFCAGLTKSVKKLIK